MSTTPELHKLYQLAKDAMERAYNPYSKFHVGAAFLSKAGHYYAGCNVENISYSLTICAEGNAISTAVHAEEDFKIEQGLVISSDNSFCPPCGACRQIIAEFATPETMIHLARTVDDVCQVRSYSAGKLLPLSFSQSHMAAAFGTASVDTASPSLPMEQQKEQETTNS